MVEFTEFAVDLLHAVIDCGSLIVGIYHSVILSRKFVVRLRRSESEILETFRAESHSAVYLKSYVRFARNVVIFK